MATGVELEPYQTQQDEQERPLVLHLGELPIHIRPDLVRAFLAAQVPYVSQIATDARAKTLRLAFKAAAKLCMDFIVLPKARAGLWPMPDLAAVKADVLGYSVLYWSDLVLTGLQSVEWEVLYVESADNAIEITGLAPTSGDAVDAAGPAQSTEGDASTAADAPTGQGQDVGGGPLTSLVSGGHDGQRQDDIRAPVSAGDAQVVA